MTLLTYLSSAGATALNDIDWHAARKNAPESSTLEQEFINIHEHGRRQPVNADEQHPEFAAARET
jgi:hypothetical protein